MKPKTTEKRVNLTCLERVAITETLATYKEGNFVTFRTLGELRRKVGFTADEITSFNLKEANGNITWNEQGSTPKEFSLNEIEAKLIHDQLVFLDQQSKLTQLHLSIYEMFV